jgi:hypothetical protein
MTTVPTWAAFAVSLGTPLLTLAGVLVAQWILRKGANELETRSKREETLRVLRWSAELAVSDDEGKAKLGVSQLNALGDSDLLDRHQQLFVDAALRAVVDVPVEEIEQAPEEDVEVVEVVSSDSGRLHEGEEIIWSLQPVAEGDPDGG